MKKVLFAILILMLFSGVFFWVYYQYNFSIEIQNISYSHNEEDTFITIQFTHKMKGMCDSSLETVFIQEKSCTLKVLNEESTLKIYTKFETLEQNVNPNINEVLSFEVVEDFAFVAVGEEKKIKTEINKIGNPNIEAILSSSNESILRTEENKIYGIQDGEVVLTIQIGNISKDIPVTVTSLITTPKITKNKQSLACNIYTQEQNELLDQILKYKIEKAGYQTRAGVVTALRFLTLEFPYQINYFFENGRLNNNTGGRYVDAEGRYYHQGLYLNTYKYAELDANSNGWGPAIWGCPLMNWQDEAGFEPWKKYPNGLDCSGAVAWAMYNGGFNPKDTGAGSNSYYHDGFGDLGSQVPITWSLLQSKTLKAGDLIGSEGHVGLIGGLKEGYIYVFESTTYYNGLVMHEYSYQELINNPELVYVIRMDDYYKEDGNYTEYWE